MHLNLGRWHFFSTAQLHESVRSRTKTVRTAFLIHCLLRRGVSFLHWYVNLEKGTIITVVLKKVCSVTRLNA